MTRSVPAAPPGMRGLRRDPALVPLSRDHHFVLRQALFLRRAASGKDLAAATAVARDHLAFHDQELRPHVADEEALLLPASLTLDPEGADRVRREHREIEALAGRLRDTLEAGGDPRAVMAELASLLHDHVRYEERAWFPALQQGLPAGRLREIGEALAERPRVCPTR